MAQDRLQPPLSTFFAGLSLQLVWLSASPAWADEGRGEDDGICRPETHFPIPFELAVDPMDRLLLINIENDPDRLYVGFEPQVFADETTGTGMLVIAWRVDGRVDVYHQPGLSPDPAKFDIAGAGLAHMRERPLEGAFFEVTERGAQAYLRFSDIEDRDIEIRVEETSPRRRNPFDLLAPMGEAAERPSALPLIFLHDFYFVRRHGTELVVRIQGVAHQPDRLPFPLDRSRMYYTRYSPDPLILTLNPAFEGELQRLRVAERGTILAGGISYDFACHDGNVGLARMALRDGDQEATLSFEPKFPDLSQVAAGRAASGEFRVRGGEGAGEVVGSYEVRNMSDEIGITMKPSRWIPNERRWMLRFVYAVGPFRTWPASYTWEASVAADSGAYHMRSEWRRD